MIDRAKRFSESALKKGMPLEMVYQRDVDAASLKFFQGFLEAKFDFGHLNNLFGSRSDGSSFSVQLEQDLPERMLEKLFLILQNAIDSLSEYRKRINSTFDLPSEYVRFECIDKAQETGQYILEKKLSNISPDDFSRVVLYVRRALELSLEKYNTWTLEVSE